MNYTLHRCTPAGFECCGGGDSPHACEVDSWHGPTKGTCIICSIYPTDSKILNIVMWEHAGYPDREKTIYYRDKTKELQTCQCPITDLWRDGHQKECPEKS